MIDQLEQIKREALAEIKQVDSPKDLDTVRVKYLGKKGSITTVLRGMGGAAVALPMLEQQAQPKRTCEVIVLSSGKTRCVTNPKAAKAAGRKQTSAKRAKR